jgi:sulfatase maturation enzyme AslB (radical SAM superfamily)
MVLLPEFHDQILPLARLGHELGVDYLVIKHCSDDEQASLGVDYAGYEQLTSLLHEAEVLSSSSYQVSVKWSKILSGGKRTYQHCFGPPFIMQMSGSGLVAPCGMLFNSRYHRYHIGNIAETSFKELWQGERYWEVMKLIASEKFDARTMCGSLCLQHKVNEFLQELRHGNAQLPEDPGAEPPHVNFI